MVKTLFSILLCVCVAMKMHEISLHFRLRDKARELGKAAFRGIAWTDQATLTHRFMLVQDEGFEHGKSPTVPGYA